MKQGNLIYGKNLFDSTLILIKNEWSQFIFDESRVIYGNYHEKPCQKGIQSGLGMFLKQNHSFYIKNYNFIATALHGFIPMRSF